MIASKLFRIEAWRSVAHVIVLITLIKRWPGEREEKAGRQLIWLTLATVGCAVVGYFGLPPFMSVLREAAVHSVIEPEARSRFGLLHGVSSAFYLIQSLLGGVLVWKFC